MVRAKFLVQSKTENADHGFEIEMWPVVGGSPENEAFYKYTPGGKIGLVTVNPDAAAQFTPGKKYYVSFEEAPE